jgi:hypothetical protein
MLVYVTQITVTHGHNLKKIMERVDLARKYIVSLALMTILLFILAMVMEFVHIAEQPLKTGFH